MSAPESWEPRVGDRVVYRGSRTDWRDAVATVTDLSTSTEGVQSVVLWLDDDRRVTTVRQTLRPAERSIDPATSGGAS